MKYQITILTLLFSSAAFAQSQTKRALFLGNSYTYVNDLPQMVADAATSIGDTLVFDSNTPGGQNLYGHTFDAASLNKIKAGNWGYVVLQAQSQEPSLPTPQVINGVFPYAHLLDSLINAYSPCGETVFYMTWGRKNGDSINCFNYPTWQYICTYEGMDSLLNLRYRMMADSNDAVLSPVGAVWHYIRQNFPLIDLYQSDESHPSVAGTYAAACCFYATLFRKDPTLISFNSTLPVTDAANIRSAAKVIVFDSLMNWHIGEYDPLPNYTYFVSGANQITFTNGSVNAATYTWYFGDGDTSTAVSPVHTYAAAGPYTVTLVAAKCDMQDTITHTINVTGIQFPGNQNLQWSIYTNPVGEKLKIKNAELRIEELRVYNVVGEMVLQLYASPLGGAAGYSVGEGLDISSLNAGLYFLELFSNGKSLGLKKFIKTSN